MTAAWTRLSHRKGTHPLGERAGRRGGSEGRSAPGAFQGPQRLDPAPRVGTNRQLTTEHSPARLENCIPPRAVPLPVPARHRSVPWTAGTQGGFGSSPPARPGAPRRSRAAVRRMQRARLPGRLEAPQLPAGFPGPGRRLPRSEAAGPTRHQQGDTAFSSSSRRCQSLRRAGGSPEDPAAAGMPPRAAPDSSRVRRRKAARGPGEMLWPHRRPARRG